MAAASVHKKARLELQNRLRFPNQLGAESLRLVTANYPDIVGRRNATLGDNITDYSN